MLARARTFTLDGVDARPVDVEVHVQRGLPAFTVVGLPDAAVRESRERVRSAIVSSEWDFPLQRITVNLAPADLRKGGPGFDLAIAAGLLAASGQLPPALLEDMAFGGELALDGTVRGVAGTLAVAQAARSAGVAALAVASANGPEAALIAGLTITPLDRLCQLGALADGTWSPQPPTPLVLNGTSADAPDLADLRGQPALCHALEVAAAGGHSMLILGPPGAGKSLAAKRLPSLLPPLSPAETLEVARIASVCGRPGAELAVARPFRAPHHTISAAGLIGGGNPPRAGEITLAHHGVLFLDELGEFTRQALESLRVPVEDGSVRIARAGHTVRLPCRFTLLAAANPCPCGRGADDERCSCSAHAISRYQAKLSGALADRIDISLSLGQPGGEAMKAPPGEASAEVRERVLAARERQQARLAGRCNAEMSTDEARTTELTEGAVDLLVRSHNRLRLSGRAHDRVIRVARTLADLAGADVVREDDIHGALALRRREAAA